MTLPLPSRRFLSAALILAGAGVAAACTTTSAARATDAAAPFACEIAVSEASHGTRFEARVQATEALSGQYSFSLAGRGTNIRQGGPFTARPGQTVTLGQSMLSGAASAYDTELTLTVNGQRYSCASVATDL
jgi:hypothetical protein